MSESERLARLQSQSVGTGATLSGSSTFEGDAYHDNLLGVNAGSLGGGSTRSKSWESSSKWQSGTQVNLTILLPVVFLGVLLGFLTLLRRNLLKAQMDSNPCRRF